MNQIRQWISNNRKMCQKNIKDLSMPSCIDVDKEKKIYGWQSRIAQLQDLSSFLNDQEIDG